MHQGGQGDAGTYHIAAEGMTKPVWVGLGYLAAESVMAKKGAQSSGSHRASAMAALERYEQCGRVRQRPLQVEIVLQDLQGIGGKGHEALLASLAEDVKAGFGQREILELELQDFAGAQAVE